MFLLKIFPQNRIFQPIACTISLLINNCTHETIPFFTSNDRYFAYRRGLQRISWRYAVAWWACLSTLWIYISKHHYKLTQKRKFKGLYKCKDCRKRFTVRRGTMFEDSELSLKKWLYAIFLFLSYKKGISSSQLACDIHVIQKPAWFMLHRICHNIKDDATFDDMT